MGRPRSFDPDRVLDGVMDLFWQKGYQGTSVDDLVEHTGVNRASLYNTFGGKRALFIAAIHRYQTEKHMHLIRSLQEPGPAKVVIRRALEAVAEDVLRCGCLITNTAIELGPRDPAITELVNESWKWMEDGFADVIERGQQAGEITNPYPPRRLAKFLVSVVQGIGVVGKATQNGQETGDIATMALAALN